MVLNIQGMSKKKKACTRTLIKIRMFSSKTIPQNVNDASDLASWGNERKMLHTSLSTEAIEAETIPPRQLERLFSSSSTQQEWQEKNSFLKWKIVSFWILTSTQFLPPVKQVLSA